MADSSFFTRVFQPTGSKNFTADDLILNLIIPVSQAGEINEAAEEKNKEEMSIYHLNHKLLETLRLSAGSSSDGLSLPEISAQKGDFEFTEGPDEDIMYLFTALKVDSGNRWAFCSTDSTYSSPGYTRLVFNMDWLKKRPSKNHREMGEEQMIKKSFPHFLESEQNKYIDRNKMILQLHNFLHDDLRAPEMERQLIRYSHDDVTQLPEVSYSHHGPAITVDRIVSFGHHTKVFSPKDYVVALPCPRWPLEASDWIIRPRVWPSKSLVRRIVKSGCHIVAKQDKVVKDVRDFLFSFSQCEKVLALNLTVFQKRCYMLFKYLFKYSIDKRKRGLSTYHCKTVFFYRCETTTPEQWSSCNVFECLIWLLSDLEMYLQNGFLPQYFISKMNMILGISQKAIELILRDIAKIKAEPVHTILELLASNRFCWLSKDISISKIVLPLLEDGVLTAQNGQKAIVDFASALLDKGEVAVAVSILCDSMNSQKMPSTNEVINRIECIMRTNIGASSVALKGLLATLLHEKALEYFETNEDCDQSLVQTSLFLFEDVIKNVGVHTWIVSEYFNLLFNTEQYGKIVQCFLEMLKENYLFEGGIYTNVFSHNILTVDPEIQEAAEITVPSLVYVAYKVIIACTKLASNILNESTDNLVLHLARRILRNLSIWFRNKLNMYPETIDENIHVILGLCYRAVGDDKNFQRHFNAAESINCTYGDESDDLIVKPRLTDNIKSAKSGLKQTRFKPYESVGKRYKQLKLTSKNPQIRRFILNPFIHFA